MKDFLKEIRLTLGQVLVVLANAFVVMGWGIKLDSDVDQMIDTMSRIETLSSDNERDIDDLMIRLGLVEGREIMRDPLPPTPREDSG